MRRGRVTMEISIFVIAGTSRLFYLIRQLETVMMGESMYLEIHITLGFA